MKLSEVIAKLEVQYDRGILTENDFLSACIEEAGKQVAEAQNAKRRYHVAISCNTKGDYQFGTTDHYVDTVAGVQELFDVWIDQPLKDVAFVALDGVEINSGTKKIHGADTITSFVVNDRDWKRS